MGFFTLLLFSRRRKGIFVKQKIWQPFSNILRWFSKVRIRIIFWISHLCAIYGKSKKKSMEVQKFLSKIFFGQTLEESSRIYFDYFHYSYFSLSSVVSSKWVNLIHTTARGIHKYLHIYCSSYFYLHRKFNNNVLEFFLVREVSNVNSWIRASVIKKEFHVVDLIFRKMY